MQRGVEELSRVDLQGERQSLHVLNGDVSQRSLYGADVRSINRSPVGQFFLGNAPGCPDDSDISRKQLLK